MRIGPLCGLVVRPKNAPAKLATLLELTIYADPDVLMRFSARVPASRGYAAVVALVRGKGCSDGQPVPYATNSDDAVAAIDWITKQPWSDGRVGMFGGSYSGGSAWAATKRIPKALKTYKDRSDVDRKAPGGHYLDKAIDTYNGIVLETAPVAVLTEISGLFTGHLDFDTNKRSLDCQIDLYALSKAGEYFALAPWWSRVRGRSVDFQSLRLMSHLCSRATASSPCCA